MLQKRRGRQHDISVLSRVGLDLIAFPLQADPSEVPLSALRSLGFLNLAAALLTLFAIWAFHYYKIDRKEFDRTKILLAEMRAKNAASASMKRAEAS